MSKPVHEMTAQERRDEILEIGVTEAKVLRMPLMSDGSLSSTQWNRMGKAARATLQRDGQRRLELEARIRELSKTDEGLAADRAAEVKRETAEKRARLERDIALFKRVGVSSRTGKITPTYARQIAAAERELAAMGQP